MSCPAITEETREEAKHILADLMRGRIYRDEAVDKLAALFEPQLQPQDLYRYGGE